MMETYAMRKLGKPAPGESRKITADESINTGLSRSTMISNVRGKIFFECKAKGPASNLLVNAKGESMPVDAAREKLEAFWQAKIRQQ